MGPLATASPNAGTVRKPIPFQGIGSLTVLPFSSVFRPIVIATLCAKVGIKKLALHKDEIVTRGTTFFELCLLTWLLLCG